ncbi:hypothetical protein M409DRAFT_63682 [Zasmidium cellare ATCC 36951]|uniref:Uncharacterized protein n=1 Tax=Zasmidium cellare ATCC 36951 TaxID=1080233 RepID=A0A6A6CW88_ZASCE|nr:uncharacterized protein M409DRAFT_63682 [Zasmidium cellare ATCC 36951]KAF2171371.1 hypothetical protein M409DRAFT_63682 [Zasmidium cellare ATCC 36951]
MSSYTPLQKSSTPRDHRFWYDGSTHILSILLAATTVALFPVFSYSPWSIPATYSLKTTQQYVNFVVIAVALLVSVIFSHCLSITNNVEASAEFKEGTLTFARLETRSGVSRKDVIGLIGLSWHNGPLWRVSGPCAIAIAAFSTMSWVLSLIFVIDARLMPYSNNTSNVNLTLGIDIPEFPDACRESLTAANCTYGLASSALTSQLITHTPFTFGNVTFSGPDGTQALPVDAMKHFANQTLSSKFGNEEAQYCLPVLKPNLVTCAPVDDDSRAKYTYITSRPDTYLGITLDMYEISINPDTDYNQTYVVTSQNNGTMVVSRSKKPEDTSLTVLTGSGLYADILSRLTTGNPAPYTNETYNETQFTALCDAPYNDQTYSWKWVNFTLNGGVMSANATNQTCRENGKKNPMGWLDYAFEKATQSNNVGDGYSKLLNTDYLAKSGPDYDRMVAFDMSPLEYILSQIVAIVLTAWSATNPDIAGSTPISHKTYEHRYVVVVEIKDVTILALCMACLILLCTILQAWRWLRASSVVRRRDRKGDAEGLTDPSWELMEPMHLLAYGASASEGISKLGLAQQKCRERLLRDRNGPILGCGPGTLLPSSSVEMRRSAEHGRHSSTSSLLQVGQEQPPRDILP